MTMKPLNRLLIVDMQNDFINPNGSLYIGSHAKSLVKNIERYMYLNFFPLEVFYTKDWHSSEDPEFEYWHPHCIEYTWGSEIIPELMQYTDPDVTEVMRSIALKRTFSAVYPYNFETFHNDLTNPSNTRWTVVGVCTDICVLHTVADLLKIGYDVTVVENCVTSFDFDAHDAAIKHMRDILGVKVI